MFDRKCAAYVDEVLKFRKALNLTSISNAEVFEKRFIKPSIALAEWLPETGRMLDIGSGMGIPGIPLLIKRPGLQGVLVERRVKRTEFLRHVIRQLGLNAVALNADVRKLDPLSVDVCVARAVTDESGLLAMCAPHMVVGGCAVLPVPMAASKAIARNWTLESESMISSGDEQLIRCYRYG
ncbi:MAG TPA: RsmG family class I SAM-dependent methyltransferase [Mariprofundaceae bacterium]|nr:RsmG family class I SAM-dependent methyltransferase [Mariprofundaceae bacterium]